MPKQPQSSDKNKDTTHAEIKLSKIDSEDMSEKYSDINLESDSDEGQQFENDEFGDVKHRIIPDYDSDVDASKNALSDNDDDFNTDENLTKSEYDSDGPVQFNVSKVLEKKKAKSLKPPKK
jgi:hypothetical protein